MVSPKIARVQLWEGSPGCSTGRGSLGRAWHTSWVKENKLRGRDFRVGRAFSTSAWELTKVLETHRWSLPSIRLLLISSCSWDQERTNERLRRSRTRHRPGWKTSWFIGAAGRILSRILLPLWGIIRSGLNAAPVLSDTSWELDPKESNHFQVMYTCPRAKFKNVHRNTKLSAQDSMHNRITRHAEKQEDATWHMRKINQLKPIQNWPGC